MIVMMIIGFFTTRITLAALGVDNYGIYNVVGGLVSMFSLVSNSLSASISRFITFGLGKRDLEYLKKIFGVSLNIQILIVIIVVILLETAGIWFLNHKLVIPSNRLFAANIVFQFSILSFAISLLNLPYNASIIAHEKMSAFAYMTLFEALCKLGVAYAVMYIDTDKLILYGGLLIGQGIITQFIYWIYCKVKFEECKYKFIKDKTLYKEIFRFSGWNFIGSSAGLFADQGVNMVLNMFFGPVVNTARGIGIQVNSILWRFSGNFMTAIDPQITKSYAAGNYNRTYSLMSNGTKFSFYLFLILSIPVLLETPQALQLWLGQQPEYAINFARLAIILTWSNVFSNALITAQLATGKIKTYQIVVGSTNFLNLPLSYLVLKLGAPPSSVMIVAIVISQTCFFLRLKYLNKMMEFSIRRYLKDVYFKSILVTFLSLPIPIICYLVFPQSLLRFVIITLLSIINTMLMVYYVGCNKSEKQIVQNQITKFKIKLNLA